MAKLDAIEQLREILQPGDVLLTRLQYTDNSGPAGPRRSISVHFRNPAGELEDLTPLAREVLGFRRGRHGGMNAYGAGMDMGFHAVYSLGRMLWPDGHFCIGWRKRCPSNDHSNDWITFGQKFDAKHGRPGAFAPSEVREAYLSARQEYLASVRTYRTDRKHRDGGYALRHNWLR